MAVAEMIVRNVGHINEPDEFELMVGYVNYVLA